MTQDKMPTYHLLSNYFLLDIFRNYFMNWVDIIYF